MVHTCIYLSIWTALRTQYKKYLWMKISWKISSFMYQQWFIMQQVELKWSHASKIWIICQATVLLPYKSNLMRFIHIDIYEFKTDMLNAAHQHIIIIRAASWVNRHLLTWKTETRISCATAQAEHGLCFTLSR